MVFFVVFAVISLGIISVLGKKMIVNQEKATIIEEKRVEVMTAKYEKSILSSEVSAILQGNEKSDISFEISGRIVAMEVKEGDKISVGEILARLDAGEHSSEVTLSATEIDKAKVKFQQAKREFIRMEELYRKQAIARSKYEEAENEFSITERDYLQAQRDYAIKTDKNLIKSPINGIVLANLAAVGQMVTDEVPVYRIGQVDRLKALLPVPDREIAFWHVGDTVELSLYQDTRQGKVVRVFPTTNEGTGTISVEVIVDNLKQDWRPGQVITASRPVKEKTGIFIPNEALLNCGEDRPYLFIVEEGKALKKSVTIGDMFDNRLEILEGLREGDQVVIRGADRLFDMDAVQATGRGQK